MIHNMIHTTKVGRVPPYFEVGKNNGKNDCRYDGMVGTVGIVSLSESHQCHGIISDMLLSKSHQCQKMVVSDMLLSENCQRIVRTVPPIPLVLFTIMVRYITWYGTNDDLVQMIDLVQMMTWL